MILLFFISISKLSLSRRNFGKTQLRTITRKLGDLNLCLAYDNRLTTYELGSELLLIQTVAKLDEAHLQDALASVKKGPLASSILSIIFADLKKGEMYVYRPFHGRPLYYFFDEIRNAIYIATHIKLLKEAGIKIEEEEKAVAEYFFFGNVLPPLTIYKGIFKVARGQTLQIKCIEDSVAIETKDIPIPSQKETALDENEVTDKIYQILRSSIFNLEQFKNSVALSFSGGLDSSILARLLEDEVGNIHCYSLSYPFEDSEKNQETVYARTAARALNLNYEHFQVDYKEYLNCLIEMIAEGEAPIWYYLQTPLFIALLKRQPNNEQIVILGEGSDSLFGNQTHRMLQYLQKRSNQNHTSRSYTLILNLSKNRHFRKLLRVVFRLVGKQSSNLELVKAKIDDNFEDPNNFLWQMSMLGDKEWTERKFKFSLEEIVSERKNRLEPFLKNPMSDLVSLSNLFGYESLSVLSKIGEKYNRTVLYPYLDDALVNYSFQLSWNFKLQEPKHALRQVARKIGVPDFIITRPKKGFGTKAEYWALPGKIFEPIVTLGRNVFSPEEFRSMQSTNSKKRATYWFMMNYAIWKEIFINGTEPDKLKKELNGTLELAEKSSN